MCAATGWQWTRGSPELFIHFTMVNLRLSRTRIWKTLKFCQSKNDEVKLICGTAALLDNDPHRLLWNSGTKHWKLAQSELVIGLFSFQTRLIVLVY